MPPKRKGRSAAAKSQKRSKEEAAAPEKIENAAKIDEEVKMVEEVTGESKISAAEKTEAVAEDKEKSEEENELGEKDGKGEKGDKGEKGEKDEEKPKGKGRKKAAPLVPGTKRVTRSNPAPKEEEEAAAAAAPKKSVHIVIEHFKNPVFKRRADKVRDELLGAEAELNLSVSFNPDKLKPAEGRFVIRDEAGKIFLELQDEKPFTKVKEMDAESVVEDILKQIS